VPLRRRLPQHRSRPAPNAGMPGRRTEHGTMEQAPAIRLGVQGKRVREDGTARAQQDGDEAMRIERRYTRAGEDAYAGIEFRLTASEIRNPDGSTVFKADA